MTRIRLAPDLLTFLETAFDPVNTSGTAVGLLLLGAYALGKVPPVAECERVLALPGLHPTVRVYVEGLRQLAASPTPLASPAALSPQTMALMQQLLSTLHVLTTTTWQVLPAGAAADAAASDGGPAIPTGDLDATDDTAARADGPFTPDHPAETAPVVGLPDPPPADASVAPPPAKQRPRFGGFRG